MIASFLASQIVRKRRQQQQQQENNATSNSNYHFKISIINYNLIYNSHLTNNNI